MVVLNEARLLENPVDRLKRFISQEFWKNLTRQMDGSNIAVVGRDPKDWTGNPRPRIYVPSKETEQIAYYQDLAARKPELDLDVRILAENCDGAEYVKTLNDAPGILALAMEKRVSAKTGEKEMYGVPFVVPGGRFNELYGWDSYFTSLGLMRTGNPEHVNLVRGMITNFVFCIKNYGKILNANRSYYLCRSQPPFLTDMALQYYDAVMEMEPEEEPNALELVKVAIIAAIKEYHSVWMAQPRFDPETGLSRYRPTGSGLPPETEADHFHHILLPYATKRGITIEEFIQGYNNGEISEPELDEYLLHDRAVRESGHDTSYRLEGKCADLATVDLNSCLYRIEYDIGKCIKHFFDDHLEIPEEWRVNGMDDGNGYIEHSDKWFKRAELRMQTMESCMWNPETGLFHDYDTVLRKQNEYESVTCLWVLWANALRVDLVDRLVTSALQKFEVLGGLVSGTEASRGEIRLDRPNRQWDYPFGWAPHQILAWSGLIDYGYDVEAQRLMYKWCYMVIKAFVDYNGVVVEKYNVTKEMDPHRVDAEYGNQGADFKGAPTEG
jgi:alpha,alpha-trehalase